MCQRKEKRQTLETLLSRLGISAKHCRIGIETCSNVNAAQPGPPIRDVTESEWIAACSPKPRNSGVLRRAGARLLQQRADPSTLERGNLTGNYEFVGQRPIRMRASRNGETSSVQELSKGRFDSLRGAGRLDLTGEALILQPKWSESDFFSQRELLEFGQSAPASILSNGSGNVRARIGNHPAGYPNCCHN